MLNLKRKDVKLKAGNRYRRRDGQITEPLERSFVSDFPYRDPETKMVYTNEGRLSEMYEYPFDLVELYSEPTTKR